MLHSLYNTDAVHCCVQSTHYTSTICPSEIMEAKQKRRYSCQSWHVAAKVVIKPEVDEDDITTETNIEDFVTALEVGLERNTETKGNL